MIFFYRFKACEDMSNSVELRLIQETIDVICRRI